jgi:hypothetical protein
MKHLLIVALAVFAMGTAAHAEETTVEKAKEVAAEAKTDAKKAGRAVKRAAKKGMHRMEEAACMEGDMKCAAKKTGNRIEETKDKAVDSVKDVKDEVTH